MALDWTQVWSVALGGGIATVGQVITGRHLAQVERERSASAERLASRQRAEDRVDEQWRHRRACLIEMAGILVSLMDHTSLELQRMGEDERILWNDQQRRLLQVLAAQVADEHLLERANEAIDDYRATTRAEWQQLTLARIGVLLAEQPTSTADHG